MRLWLSKIIPSRVRCPLLGPLLVRVMTRPFLHFWLMPWAEFGESLRFGEIEIWDFYKHGPSRIPDSQEMLWLSQFMACFYDPNGTVLKNVAVIQIGPEPFCSLDSRQNAKIRWAAKAIGAAHIFASVLRYMEGKREANFSSSDRFRIKDFSIDTEFIYHSEGRAIGACEIFGRHLAFREPAEIGDKMDNVDRELLNLLAKLNEQNFETHLWKQLDTSFEWLLSAWSKSALSEPAQYIALMTAFEALVRRKQSDNAPKLARRAETICDWSDFPRTETHVVKGEIQNISKPSRFIIDFAGYRNEFVHGGQMPFGHLHYKVGSKSFNPKHAMTMVLYSLVVNLLLQEKLNLDTWREAILTNQVEDIARCLHWNATESMVH